MRQVFLEKGLIKVKKVCEPLLDDNMVLVAVRYSCISPGTEGSTISSAQQSLFSNMSQKLSKIVKAMSTDGIQGTKALVKEKLSSIFPLGYSCSGQVIAVGKNIRRFQAGDLVACAGASNAYHADVIVVPENLVTLVNKEENLRDASMTTLGAIAMQGFRRANMQLGETICVIGLGLLGQLTLQLAKQAGCTVIGIDLLAERLQLAKKLGADIVLNPAEDEINKEVAFATAHHGVDATIITAGSKSNSIVQQAMEVTRRKGRVVLVGDVGLQIEREPFYQKEIDFLMSCSYGPGRYDEIYEKKGNDYPFAYVRWTENRNMEVFVKMLETKHLDIASLITQEVAIDDVQEAYEKLKEQKALSIILSYKENQVISLQTDNKQKTSEQNGQIKFLPAVKDTIRVGMIGAGGFAKVKLIPIVSRIKNVKINAIVDANIANCQTVSKIYEAACALTDDSKLFDEDMIDAVVIASPHKYHAAQALTALQNGKAVFVEKPMVTDFDQLNEMRQFFKNNTQVPFCVDYNRSYAPFIFKIKKELDKRQSPLIIQYRMNAGFIPKDHWIQTEVGAGRIIGEACHIFDLFCFLTAAEPRSVSVEALRPKNNNLFPTDNFSAQIGFSDGSICNLVYTSLGHNDLSKERMEIFYDSKTILMDDYKVLQGFGLPSSFNEKTMKPDKGHEQLLKEFFRNVTKDQFIPPISLKRLDMVAELTLIIDQLACAGGGQKEVDERV
jgi:predicted dehydrogenase/threonine dehydrogenase-like Zn-dependent dehydrogenase